MLLLTPPLMWKVCAKLVPRLLNDDQKERHLQVCQDIIEHLQTEPDLLRRVITVDEPWIFEYDPETKRHSCQWKSLMSLRPKKARQSKSKVMFFDVRGIVHIEFLPQGQTIIQQVYEEILPLLLRSVRERRDESCGRTNRGCFTTTLHLLTRPSASRGSSWPRRTSPYWNNLPIHPILLRVTF